MADTPLNQISKINVEAIRAKAKLRLRKITHVSLSEKYRWQIVRKCLEIYKSTSENDTSRQQHL